MSQLTKGFEKVDLVEGRVFTPKKLLAPQIVRDVYTDFRKNVPAIFDDNLVFGFIFGGFAKGFAAQDQDADFFLCLHHLNPKQIENFHAWYFDLHRKYGFAPDLETPGSIGSLEHVIEKLEFAIKTPLRQVIETSYEKQCIVWADLMTGEKAAKIGDISTLNDLEQKCEGLPQRWRQELLAFQGANADLETAKLPITRLFRKTITYLKQGDNMSPPSLNAE